MKISRREKILILIAFFMLIIFGGIKLVINPTRAELDQAKAVNSQIDQLVQKTVQTGKQKDDSQTVVSREMSTYLQLEEQLPRDKQLVEMIDQIGKLAGENKIALLSVDYIDSKAKTKTEQVAEKVEGKDTKPDLKSISNMDLSLSVVGSYYHLLGFLQDLEKSPRIIVVNTASMSVGQWKDTGASVPAGNSNSTYIGSNTSSNPPPAMPIAKGTRVQTSVSAGSSVPVQVTVSEPVVPQMSKYDLGNIQMNLQITTFYDTTQADIGKLLGAAQAKQINATKTTAVSKEENLLKVTAAAKKFWNQDNPTANWSKFLNPGDNCWNGQLLNYLEGKYSNTNMGKNARGLVNPLAKKINPDSEWAGTAIFHWNRVLDMNMTSTIKPVDPETGKAYANIKTRDFLPAAVYITYLPNYAPEQVEKLSPTQKQAIMGSIIVWQARYSKEAPVVYRIDDQGLVQDLQKLESK